jgi:hypothetical protein
LLDEESSQKASGWKRAFDDPIPLPSGRKLVTLLDAATYATKLPKKELPCVEARRSLIARAAQCPALKALGQAAPGSSTCNLRSAA